MKKEGEEKAAALEAGEAGAVSGAPVRLHPFLRDARAVLFDAGGTLAHPEWERIALLAEQETGRVFAPAEMRRTLSEALRSIDARLSEKSIRTVHTQRPGWVFREVFCALGVDEAACERLSERMLAAHDERHLWCGLDPEAPRVVGELKRAGLRVGVISNTEDGRLKELLELVDIATHFDLLVDSHVVGLRKPDAVIFHHAVQQLNVSPHEAVYIGDSYGHDVLGAQGAGLRAILLDSLDLYADSDCPRIRALGELIGE